MNYTPKKESTKKLFGLHNRVEAGKLSKEKALKKAVDELGYTRAGAQSWMSWWTKRAAEALGLDDASRFSEKSQKRMAARLRKKANEMKEPPKPLGEKEVQVVRSRSEARLAKKRSA